MSPGTLGQRFFAAESTRAALAARHGLRWQSAAVELEATLLTAGPLPPDTGLPPFAEFSFDSVAARLGQSLISGGAVPFLRETANTEAVTYVGVGAAKPESQKTLTVNSEPVRKLAHWLTVPDELLDDVEGAAGYLNANLTVGLVAELDQEIINGAGGASAIQGLITLAGKTTNVAATAGASLAAIGKAIADVWSNSKRRPDTVVINPATYNVAVIPATKNDPLQAIPGDYRVTVVLTPAMPTGQAIVGNFAQGGMLYRRGPISVQASNTHGDFFQKNLTAMRGEIRVAVVWYVPAAFCLVTGIA